MKKIILTIIILFIAVCNYAQEIKIKKGEVLLDGSPIAKIDSKPKEYKISNLDGSNSIIAYMRVGNPYAFIELKNEAIDKSNEMDFVKYSPFNVDRSIIQTLFSKGLITANGIEIEKVNTFLNEAPAGLSEKYRYVKQEVIDETNAVADTYQLSIDDAGVIYSIKAQNPDPLDKRIGYIKMTSPSTNGELKYEAIDLDGYVTAVWFAKGGMYSNYSRFLNEELITADQKVFKAAFDNRGNPIGYKMSKDVTALNIVRVLVGNGYVLQHQGIEIQNRINALNNAEQGRLNKERFETAKLKSKNIYDKKGYVITETGEKIPGEFTIEFKDIRINPNNPISVGKNLYRTDVNPHEKYQSKTGVRFCIENDSSEECYVGLTCGGESMTASLIRSLDADNSSFYKVLYEDNGYMVLTYPSETEYYIIKIPNQEKGLYTTKSSNSKLKKNIAEYFKCDSFVFENYDFKTLEGLIKVLDDYKNNCKK